MFLQDHPFFLFYRGVQPQPVQLQFRIQTLCSTQFYLKLPKMSNASNGCEGERRREAVDEEEGGGASAHGYSPQIKSDYILRGRLRCGMSRRLVCVSSRTFYESPQSISRLNEGMETRTGQHIDRKTPPRKYQLNKAIQANE